MNSTESVKIRALVADDNEVNREILIRILSTFSIQTEQAADGIEALSLLNQNTYELILIDYIMPGMKGTEVLRAFQTKEVYAPGDEKRKPLILGITAEVSETVTAEYRAAGADATIEKPFRVKELENLLIRHFNGRIKRKVVTDSEKETELITQKSIREIAKSVDDLFLYSSQGEFSDEERRRFHIAVHSIKGLLSDEKEKAQLKNAILILGKLSAKEAIRRAEVKAFFDACVAYSEQVIDALSEKKERFLPELKTSKRQEHEKKAIQALRIFDYCSAKSELTCLYEAARGKERDIFQKAIGALECYDYTEAERILLLIFDNKNTSV